MLRHPRALHGSDVAQKAIDLPERAAGILPPARPNTKAWRRGIELLEEPDEHGYIRFGHTYAHELFTVGRPRERKYVGVLEVS